MVGLIEIAPRAETVDVQGAPVAVHGISAKGVAHLLGRFPELRKLMTGQDVAAHELMAVGGDAVAGMIAAGLSGRREGGGSRQHACDRRAG